jgi:hypothetical protein
MAETFSIQKKKSVKKSDTERAFAAVYKGSFQSISRFCRENTFKDTVNSLIIS